MTEPGKKTNRKLAVERLLEMALAEMTAKERTRIDNYESLGKILGIMGIPYIKNPGTLKRMLRYWETGT